jgi:G3E family GTPase
VVLLNKCDLADPALITRTEEAIRSLNTSIPIYRTIKGELPLEQILNLDAFHSRPQFVLDYGQKEHDHAQDDGEEHGHDHFRGVSSVTMSIPILSKHNEEVLDDWIRKILWEELYETTDAEGPRPTENYMKILRCKGLYWTEFGDQVVIQGVRTLYETTITARGQVPQRGKLVLIGTGLGRHVTNAFPLAVGQQSELSGVGNKSNMPYVYRSVI